MSKRRRILMGEAVFEPDPDIPAAWKAVETIEDSWSEIVYHAKKGDYRTRYKLGDTKVANFGDEGLTLMHLVGFDCDELADGTGYAHISWVPEHCLKTFWEWNDSDNTGSGYSSSGIKTYVDSLINKLPKCLQNNIVSVKKICRSCGNADWAVNVKIWLPSRRELIGGFAGLSETSGPIYTNPPTNPKRTGASPNGSAEYSWLRSTHNNYDDSVACMKDDVFYYQPCWYSFGVVPGFCI